MFGAFGNTPTTTAPSLFSGFGTAAPAQPAAGLFGNTFGNPAPTNPAPAFGSTFGTSFGFGTTNPAPAAPTSLFGGGGFGGTTAAPQPATQSFFGGFGQPAAQQPAGAPFGTTSVFGAPAQQPQPQQPSFFGTQAPPQQAALTEAEYAVRLAAAVQNPFIFGDDRDQILAKFNSVQATVGTGKCYFAVANPPLELNAENVFCKWKCVVYMPKREHATEDSIVRIVFKKSGADVYEVQLELAELLHKLLGERQNVQVEIDGVNPLPNDKSELTFHVLERMADGHLRRIPAGDLVQYFSQEPQKSHLQTMQVEDIQAKFSPTKEMEKQYLEKVPPGMSSYSWYQAQKDNPDPENLFPVPIIGFEQMYEELKKEDALATLSKEVCKQVGTDLKNLEKKVEENKHVAQSCQEKLERFMLRQLHVSSTQPVIARVGQPLTQYETALCDNVNQMKDLMEAPEKNLMNRARELTANIQLHDRYLTQRAKRQPRIDMESLTEADKDNIGRACDSLISVLDACKEKIKEEKALLMKLLYDESSDST